MNRESWLEERLKIAELRMDTLFAQNYDDNWGEFEQPHIEMLEKLLSFLPANSTLLDAACGTGKYWSILLEHQCAILGIDHSQQMLNQAKRKFPDIIVEKSKLQSINFSNKFNAVICIDAMENIFPEHWPIILKNFYNALKSSGYIYFTVEMESEEILEKNFQDSIKEGFPVVIGELLEKGGYHYYPKLDDVRKWLQITHLEIVEEQESGVYHHFLVKKII